MSHFQVNKLITQAVVAIEAAAGKGLDDIIDRLIVHVSSWKADTPPTSPDAPRRPRFPPQVMQQDTPQRSPTFFLPALAQSELYPLGSPLRPLHHAAQLRRLLANPLFDAGIRTPTFDVHPHLAAAHLLLRELVEKLPTALHDAGRTARGHTLLHDVCLPRDESHIDVFAPCVYPSVRFVSALDPAWKPTRLYANPPLFGLQDEGIFDAQLELLGFLRWCRATGALICSLWRCYVDVDEDEDAVRGVWETAKNGWGEARHMKFWEEGYGQLGPDEDLRIPWCEVYQWKGTRTWAVNDAMLGPDEDPRMPLWMCVEGDVDVGCERR
ncbi:hypothetical protein GGX14DRAFT_636608 [Mycena pura]|uniref:Uncharacterized protein n=1 Tax=Mycena pura TaxID=153505 RepID=A0AAD6VAA7_9AGAR|nr:hypothetical protein GGX14DRAFT_636608 [Mycena pura]